MTTKVNSESTPPSTNFVQVIVLSFSFMFLFTAFQTTEIIMETVLQSLRNESGRCENSTVPFEGTCPNGKPLEFTFTGNGYIALGIVQGCFSIASWIAPSVVAIVYPKWSMVVMSTVYVAVIASFLVPATWLLYFLSTLVGGAAAVLWTAQGTFLSWVSTPETITRNSGVFWSINQTGLLFGNLLFYLQLSGKTALNGQLRATIFIPLTVVGLIGTALLCLLKNVKKPVNETKPKELEASDTVSDGAAVVVPEALNSSLASTALRAFTESLRLFSTVHMLLLSLCSIYTGLEYSFISGVYSTAVGNTKLLGADSKKYVGLVGVLTGVGEVVGGSLFGLLGKRTTKKGRTPIVVLGAVMHLVSFTNIYFNLPDASTIQETHESSFFREPNVAIALSCAFLLGFGDACLQTQLIATFASAYQDKSSAAFAIFRFTQSAAAAAAFVSSSYVGIFNQMIFLFCFCLVSATAFAVVEWRTGKLAQSPTQQLENST